MGISFLKCLLGICSFQASNIPSCKLESLGKLGPSKLESPGGGVLESVIFFFFFGGQILELAEI